MNDNGLILLVDDQPDNLNVLIEHLAAQNFNLSVTLDGKEAIKLSAELLPDIILLDVMMPGLDGFETCRQLKCQASSRDIPVLFMSALNETINKVKGFQAGGVDYITKPFQCDEVLARVRTHLTIRRQQQALEAKNRELEEKNALIAAQAERLEVMARTDPLTGLFNRRGFLEHAAREQARLARGESAFSLILCDIDHFKQVNDRYGHDTGDLVLKSVANALCLPLRGTDVAARWGGEEFIILLPATRLGAAVQTAGRLRTDIAAQTVGQGGQQLSVSMSFGVSEYLPGDNLDICIKRADEALYRAKHAGRNRVEPVLAT